MKTKTAIIIFESLASEPRLDAYRLLVKHGLHGLVAGEIAAALNMAPSNLSFHLKVLAQAGLVEVTQEGRYQRYRANLPQMLELIAYMTAECCTGQPEACAIPCAPSMCVEVAPFPVSTKES